MNRIGPACTAVTAWIISSAVLLPSAAQADCAQWDLSGHWTIKQTNGFTAYFDLQQSGSAITGTGAYCSGCPAGGRSVFDFGPFGANYTGPVDGSINGGDFKFVAHWGGGRGGEGEYSGKVNPDVDGGAIGGATKDLSNSASPVAAWYGDRPAKCLVAATPPSQAPPHVTGIGKRKNPPPAEHVTGIGKRKNPPPEPGPAPAGRTATVNNDVDVYAEPGGQGQPFGVLRVKSQVVVLPSQPVCQKAQWCHVQGNAVPNGSGWVWGDLLDF